MFRLLEFLSPGKSRLQREIDEAHQILEPLSGNLVDWEGDELELMSLIQEDRKVKSAFETTITGTICSIYHEHMITYHWKKISGISKMEVTIARMKRYHFNYILKNGRTSFYVNDQFLGEYRRDQLFLTKRQMIGEIKMDESEWWDIWVEGKNVGSLVNIALARHVNPRAFQLRRNLTEEQEMVFCAIAIFKIIEITRRMKKYPFK